MSKYADIISRLEAATGPDRGLFYSVLNHVWPEPPGCDTPEHVARAKVGKLMHVGAFLDAAIGLVERMLPGWGWRVQDCGNPAGVVVWEDTIFTERAVTPSIALLLAMFHALEALEAKP